MCFYFCIKAYLEIIKNLCSTNLHRFNNDAIKDLKWILLTLVSITIPIPSMFHFGFIGRGILMVYVDRKVSMNEAYLGGNLWDKK